MIRVRIDQEKCIGCGLCEELLPEVFSVGEYRTRVVRSLLRPGEEEAALSAARDCPAGAIFFAEAGSGGLPEGPAGDHDKKGDGEE